MKIEKVDFSTKLVRLLRALAGPGQSLILVYTFALPFFSPIFSAITVHVFHVFLNLTHRRDIFRTAISIMLNSKHCNIALGEGMPGQAITKNYYEKLRFPPIINKRAMRP